MKTEDLRHLLMGGFHTRPALVHPRAAADIERMLNSALAVADEDESAEGRGHIELCASAFGLNGFADDKEFVFAEGIAYIPIYGMLVNRFNWCYSWITGYQFIRRQLDAALADRDVKGIVFDVNSYGGMVYGNFELAEYIRSKRGEKPMLSMVDAVSFSGGYSLASAAGSVVLTPSGDVGSIGVVMMHMDVSKALKEGGYKVTFVYSGDHKIDGNPYEELPKEVKAEWQAAVDKSRQEFVALVATNRGITEQVVYDTEARIFDADAALALGLIDTIAPPNEALVAFRSELSGSTSALWRNRNMSTATTPAAEPVVTTPAPAVTSPAAASAAAPAAAAAVETPAAVVAAPAAQDAVANERARVAGILGCDESKGREALANHFALKTSMSLDDAKAALAAAPKAEAAKPATTPFEAAMATGNPEVPAGSTASAPGGGEQSVSDRIVASYRAATGTKAPAKSH